MFATSFSISLTISFEQETAVCPQAIYTDVLGSQKSEESLKGVCLSEKTHIRVTIAVLDIDYLVTR